MQGPRFARPIRSDRSNFAIRAAAAALAFGTSAAAQSLSWTPGPTQSHWYAEAQAPSSWSAAEQIARSFGGHLVTIPSLPVNDWLTQSFLGSSYPYAHHWIGAYQDLQSAGYSEPAGGWTWASGVPFAFTNWEAGQPDDAGGNQHFGRLSSVNPGQWMDDSDSALAGAADWYVPTGMVLIFNTTNTNITNYQLTFAPGTDTVTQ